MTTPSNFEKMLKILNGKDFKDYTVDDVASLVRHLNEAYGEIEQQAAELSRLRKRVEVLEEIANTVASRKRLVAGVLLQDLDCLYTRLAELDKETPDAEA